jgi:hypothetical protein
VSEKVQRAWIPWAVAGALLLFVCLAGWRDYFCLSACLTIARKVGWTAAGLRVSVLDIGVPKAGNGVFIFVPVVYVNDWQN